MKKTLHLALACVALLSLMPHPALFAPAATSTVVVPEFNKNRHILAHVALFAALHLAQIGYNGMLHLRQGYGGQATPATKNPANRTLKQRAAQAAANAKAFLKALATLQSYKNYGAELKAILPTPTKTGTKLSAKQWAQAVLAGTKIFIKKHPLVSVGLPLQFILGGGYTWLTRNAHLAGLAERTADQARLDAEFEKQERETAAGIKLVKIGKKFMKGFKFRKVVQQAKDAAAKAKANADKVIKIQSAYRQRLARKQRKSLNDLRALIRAEFATEEATILQQMFEVDRQSMECDSMELADKESHNLLTPEELAAKEERREAAKLMLEGDLADLDTPPETLAARKIETLRKLWNNTELPKTLSKPDGTTVQGFRDDFEKQAYFVVSHLDDGQVILETPQERAARLQAAPTPTPPQSDDEDGSGEEDGDVEEDDEDNADNGSGSDTPVHTPKPAEVHDGDDNTPVTPPKPSPAKVRVIPGFALTGDNSEPEGTICYAWSDDLEQNIYFVRNAPEAKELWSEFEVPTDASKQLTKQLEAAKKQFEAYASFGDVYEAFDADTCKPRDLCVHNGQFFEVVASGASKKAINGLIQKQITDKDKFAAAQARHKAWQAEQAEIAAEREKQAAAQKPRKLGNLWGLFG